MSDFNPQQSLRSRIKEDFLTCSICFNNFTQPKALPCLHTYCLDCLQAYVTSCATAEKFPCPMCRQEVSIPPQGLISMFLLLFIVEYILDEFMNPIKLLKPELADKVSV